MPKKRRERSYTVIAAGLFLVMFLYAIFSMNFLAEKLKAVLSGNLINPPHIVTFDVDKAQALIAEKSSAPPAQAP